MSLAVEALNAAVFAVRSASLAISRTSASGSTASAKHTWTNQGTYEVRVVARDDHGKLSPWSDPLTVTMPRGKVIHNPFLNFLQNHPNLFPILRQLLGL